MDVLFAAAFGNLLSPLVLSFVLGLVAGLVKSDLDMPEAVGKAIAIYLMLAIGMKGGVEMAQAGVGLAILPALLAAFLLSFGMPYIAYPLLRRLAGADRVNAAAVAAHYGSVSIVTFVAATQMLARDGIGYEGYLVAMLAVMETPAIIAGLLLAGRALALEGDPAAGPDRGDRRELLREVLANGSVMLLVGGFFIGWISGGDGYAAVKPFFDAPFKGVLCLFLLEMGLLVSRRVSGFQMLRPGLVAARAGQKIRQARHGQVDLHGGAGVIDGLHRPGAPAPPTSRSLRQCVWPCRRPIPRSMLPCRWG